MCAHYDLCLDTTIKREWPGFSCRKCRAFKPLELDLSEWLLDSLSCVALMGVVEHQNSFKQKRRGRIVLTLQHIQARGGMLAIG